MSKVLVVVDYQNDFVSGTLGFEKAKQLENGIVDKIKEYSTISDCNTHVICTLDTHGEDYLQTEEGKNLPVVHCVKGTIGWELYGKVKQAAYDSGAMLIEKPTFGSDELYFALRRLDNLEKKTSGDSIDTIEICGIVTNMCTISNAVVAKMALPNAHIKVIEGLCASFDENLHDAAIKVMRSMQMEVV